MNIMKTLANYPKLLTRWLVFANHVLSKSSLSPRDREIVILRVGWNCQSEYEWGQHVAIGKRAGINDEEIVRLTARFSSQEPGWAENERLLIDATDELKAFSKVSDRTWACGRTRADGQVDGRSGGPVDRRADETVPLAD